MEFVDDLADPNHNVQSASVSNQIFKQIQHRKGYISLPENVNCQVEDNCSLQVNNTTIKQAEHVK